MAVGAQQNTLPCLGSATVERPCDTPEGEAERFLGRIDVVKVQRRWGSVVAVELTAATFGACAVAANAYPTVGDASRASFSPRREADRRMNKQTRRA